MIPLESEPLCASHAVLSAGGLLNDRCLCQALSIHSVAYKQVDPCYIQSLIRTHLLAKMDDMLKTSDRDKNTPHSVGFILSTLDYTLRQVRRWNKFRTNHYSKTEWAGQTKMSY